MSNTISVTIRITSPDGSVRESALDKENLILGSGPGAAIQIADPKVSAMHLMLKVEKNGSIKAIDLGSEHGSHIGTNPIFAPTAVNSGDVINVGGSRVEVVFGPAAPAKVDVPAPVAVPPGLEPKGTRPAPKRNDFDFSNNQVELRSAIAAAPKLAPPRRPEAPVAQAPVTARAAANAPRLNPRVPFPIIGAAKAEAPKLGTHALQVALAWGDQLLGVQHYGDGYAVTIGEGRKNEFHVFSPGVGDGFTLATSKNGKLSVHVPRGANVEVFQGNDAGKQARIGQTNTIEVGLHDKVRVDVDNVSFLLRHVTPPAAVIVKRQKDDYGFMKAMSFMALLGIAVIAAMVFVPRSQSNPADNIDDKQMARAVALVIKKKTPPPPPMPKKAVEEKSGAEEGAKAKDEEGKFGKPQAEKEEADPSKKGAPVVDPNKKEKDRAKVSNMGLLAALKGKSGATSDVMGPGGLGSGINNAMGGLKGGAGIGDARGLGGMGSRGTGTGGGGTGLGLGGLGTNGTGRGAGGSGLDLGGKGHQTVTVVPGKTTVVGGLSKEVIARVIRQHQQEIKYCYESELNRTPGLAGKVAVAWVIGPDGSVAENRIQESSLGSSPVEQCMLGKIRRWKFPEVPGGGIVNVTFPWVFKPAGAGAP